MSRRTKRPLRFYNLAVRSDGVGVLLAGEFLIGDYSGDGTVSNDGEFRIVLIDTEVNGRWGLYPNLRVFGDGIGSLRRAIDDGLLDVLARDPVETVDEFGSRLREIGMVDWSSRSPIGLTAGGGARS